MSQNFNQKIGFDFSKHAADNDSLKNEQTRINHTGPKNPSEITIRDAKIQLLQTGKFDQILGVIGAGKEATVLLARLKQSNKLVCAKVYRYYTSTNIKRMNGSRHIQWDEMAMYAATKEYWNLHEMYEHNIPVPKPLELLENIAIMEFIPSKADTLTPAPILHLAPNEWFAAPEEIFYEAVDILVRTFVECHFTHGDYNTHNLMVSPQGLVTMDVTQAMAYNIHTFIDTPVRIRIDKAFDIFEQDLRNLNDNFIQKFRVSGDIDFICKETKEELPEKLQNFLQNGDKVKAYRDYVPEIFNLKEIQRNIGVSQRSNRKYQRKKR